MRLSIRACGLAAALAAISVVIPAQAADKPV
jgi:hypothetical protein